METNKNYKQAFCLNLKMLREERGLLQKDVAIALEIPVSTYANWEQGRREPSVSDIFLLCKILTCTPNDLFDIN
ncbi:MAG: helix-turn-helix transcriptional regulator [Clostridia bacterium]|nr:helix-turn-helix transcriptional regulator [Clostridia bacterium]